MKQKACITLLVLLLTHSYSYSQHIEIEPVISLYNIEALPVIEAMDWDNPDFVAETPLSSAENSEHNYKIWLGASLEGLLIKVEVTDSEHSTSYSERTLPIGDALFLGLDMLGNTIDGEIPGKLQNDDAIFVFGLGEFGPDGWIEKKGDLAIEREDIVAMIRSITRDNEANLTVYEFAVPWEKLNSSTAIAESIGVSLTIKDEQQNDNEDFDWGVCRTWGKDASSFKRFAVPSFDEKLVSAVFIKKLLRDQNEKAVIGIGWKNENFSRIAIKLGEYTQEFFLKETSENQRYTLTIPGELVNPDASMLSVQVVNDKNQTDSFTFNIETPEVIYSKFNKRIEKLIQSSPHPLVTEHLEATKLVVDIAFKTMKTPRLSLSRYNPDDIDQFSETVSYIYKKLPADAYQWETFMKQCIPLICVFRSSVDYSLQFYSLQLPYLWNEAKKYPMTVYLHGFGPGHPLQGLQFGFDNRLQNTIFRETDIDPDAIPGAHKGFLVAPWGRGNNSYSGYAENDVLEIVQLVQEKYRIDEDRVYLSGFSMGCNGSMQIAMHRPDLWAGINLASGFNRINTLRDSPELKNLKGIPIVLWTGELDTYNYGSFDLFVKVADSLDFNLVSKSVPYIPHTYPYSEYMDSIDYLMQFTRPNRSNFSYVTQTKEYPGIHGIIMKIDENYDIPIYTLNCLIDNGIVNIETEADGIIIDTGENGLNLIGDIIVIWNGNEIYRGKSGGIVRSPKDFRRRF